MSSILESRELCCDPEHAKATPNVIYKSLGWEGNTLTVVLLCIVCGRPVRCEESNKLAELRGLNIDGPA